MRVTRPLMISSAIAIVAIIVAASNAAQAQTAVYTSPAQGDSNITVPPGTAVVVPTETGTARTPEDVNAPAAPLTHHSDASAPIPDEGTGDDGDTSYMSTPHVHDAGNGITYVSGGVGKHDKAAIDAMAKDYGLKLMFSAASGPYLAAVNVTITDKSGTSVLTATTNGPFLLVNGLAAGTYTVTGTYENATVTKKIVVGKSGTKSYSLVFAQPIS